LTVPLPEPALPDVIVIHESLLTAVQVHPVDEVTPTLPVPPTVGKEALVGDMLGCGLDADIEVVDELFALFESGTEEVAEAVLVIVAPSATEQPTRATIVTDAEPPAARAEKVTVRLLPLPPQTPPPVAEHDTNETDGGRLSVSVADDASFGPLLVSVMVYVMFEPAGTGEGDPVFDTARSASPTS
jgi:hypothetical protein